MHLGGSVRLEGVGSPHNERDRTDRSADGKIRRITIGSAVAGGLQGGSTDATSKAQRASVAWR
jgi:hypothetical protein